jgi:hypothetical protein
MAAACLHPSKKDKTMIKFLYQDGTHCYRALHTVHAVYRTDADVLTARTTKPDNTGLYEFEIAGFEVLESGMRYA